MKKHTRKLKQIARILAYIIIITILTNYNYKETNETNNHIENNKITYNISNIPQYAGQQYIELNNNNPEFTTEDMNIEEDQYSALNSGKVGQAIIKTSWAKANQDDEKDDYSSITPSGFKQKKYDSNILPGAYIYHRCHIIAWKLGGIDVDKRNLMTGTRDFNVNGMKTFEDKVYNYLKENQSNHVIYRVTPYFEGENELASGVKMEAYSIEDNGKLHFNVYVYNVQDKIVIDYETGDSKLAE